MVVHIPIRGNSAHFGGLSERGEGADDGKGRGYCRALGSVEDVHGHDTRELLVSVIRNDHSHTAPVGRHFEQAIMAEAATLRPCLLFKHLLVPPGQSRSSMQSRLSMKVLSRHDPRPRGTRRSQHAKERISLLRKSRCIVQNEMTALGVATIGEPGVPRSTGFLTTLVQSVAILHVPGYPSTDAIH